MKQFTRLYNSLGMLAMLCLASCASEELNDRLLPEGKYPMTFATAMEGLTQTRATTDNTWTGNEKIAVQVEGEVKGYKPASSNLSTLTAVDAINPFYWQKAEETVSAWYSGTEYHATLPTSFSVMLNQNSVGYQQSDFLYAKPQNIKYSDRTTDPLIFKHLPAKVVVNLKYGDGLTAEDVTNATVSIVNQATTSGAIDENKGTVAQTNPGETEITSNELAVPAENYQKSVQALVVPQQMQGKKFIKVTVTIGKDAAARDYYYTPKTETDANLECGMRYTYNITVTKGEGLVVTTTKPSVSWEDEPVTSGKVEEAETFYVTCPKSSEVENFTIQNTDDQDEDKYTVKANATITISYKPNSISHRYHLAQGIANVSASIGEDEIITLTVSAIRGDLVFAFDDCVEVGDYYYSDGIWSNVYYKNKDCIGLVFKHGAATGDVASNYGGKLPNGIRGYVVALMDATQDICEWGERSNDGDTPLDNVQSADNADYNGFRNTETIIEEYWNTNKWHFYDAFQAIIDYRTKVNAPQNSSGWYLPSLKQLVDIYSLYQNSEGHILYDRLQSISPDNLFKAAPATGTYGIGGYWTSTEKNNVDAWFIRFTDGHREAFGKGQDWHKDSYVRAILTF